MAIKNGLHFIAISRKFILSPITMLRFRVKETDFTRDRKLTFASLSFLLIRSLKQNIQLELNHYLSVLNQEEKKITGITASAFVQSRKKMKSEMFYELNKEIAVDFYQDNDEGVLLYKGHRLTAVDGSTMYLPVNQETKKVYGIFNNQNKSNDVVLGQVSVLYDVLNEIVLDSKLAPYSVGEIELSRQHFLHAKENDIIIMDRAYLSFQSVFQLQEQKTLFIFRCKIHFSTKVKEFYESGLTDTLIDIQTKQGKTFLGLNYNKNTTIRVRMIRIELSSGETEILMTSLLDDQAYPYEDFQDLYFKRWGVETYYDRFKNIIGVEKFSGTSHLFIQQEFNCAIYLSNMQSILSKDAQREADQKYKDRKYEYKVNSSMSLSFLRARLIQMFTSEQEPVQIMDELKTLFVLNVVPIRPGRTFDRKTDKYRNRTKPKQFGNRRSTI